MTIKADFTGSPAAATAPARADRQAGDESDCYCCSSFKSRLIPLIAVAAVVLAGYQLLNRPEAGLAEKEMLNTASTAIAASSLTLENGLDLGSEIDHVFRIAAGVLGSINSVESARAALPELMWINDDLQNLAGFSLGLSARGKADLAGLVNLQLDDIRQLAGQVNAIPGVHEILNPVLASILEQLQGFARS